MLNIKAGCSKAAQKWFIPFAKTEGACVHGHPFETRKMDGFSIRAGCPAGGLCQ
jgi:hypothetical protein